MNDLFGAYADFYDALYAEKDYEAECDFFMLMVAKFARGPVHSVLDLGCGTGGHAKVLVDRGLEVTGVDQSEAMLAQACVKVPSATFEGGDVRDVRLRKKFDAAISMFAVVTYQTTPEDQVKFYRTARKHLPAGGLFVFDGWYGPGVLKDPPEKRSRQVGDVVRTARPVLHEERHVVDVHFNVRDGDREVNEVHPMRYQFSDEIRDGLAEAGFILMELCPFMKPGAAISERDWIFAAVARAIEE